MYIVLTIGISLFSFGYLTEKVERGMFHYTQEVQMSLLEGLKNRLDMNSTKNIGVQTGKN